MNSLSLFSEDQIHSISDEDKSKLQSQYENTISELNSTLSELHLTLKKM
jgi:hypothetical protein